MAGETESEIAGKVTFAEAVLVGSTTEAATTATITLLVGGVVGAEYVAGTPLAVVAGDTVPHGAVGHDRDHLTPLLVESLMTFAVKFAVAPACTVADVWESDTLMGGGGGLEELPPHLQAAITTGKITAIESIKRAVFRRARNL